MTLWKSKFFILFFSESKIVPKIIERKTESLDKRMINRQSTIKKSFEKIMHRKKNNFLLNNIMDKYKNPDEPVKLKNIDPDNSYYS